MSRRLATTLLAGVIAGQACGDPGLRDNDQARLPVEQEAADEGGRAQCERALPPAASTAVPPAGIPFLNGTVWFARTETVGSSVRRAYAPAAGPRFAADELVDQIRRGGQRLDGNNAGEGRATVTFTANGSSVSAVITPFCDGYVELAYHFPFPDSPQPSPQ